MGKRVFYSPANCGLGSACGTMRGGITGFSKMAAYRPEAVLRLWGGR
jgi:hypothetical protein